MRLYKLTAFAIGIISLFAGPGAAADAVKAPDTIKVGAILAVTGKASLLGAPEARTLEMMIENINAAGGINGSKVNLIIKDSGGSPEKAVSFAKQLIEEEKVFAIIGPSTTGETEAIKSIAEENKTILLSCAAGASIVNPVLKYVFKTPQNDSSAVIRIFRQMNKMGISKIGVLSSSSGFGKGGKGLIEKLAPNYNIEILANEVYDPTATDLTGEVTKIKSKNVQAIINWSVEPAQAIVIKNIRQQGMKVAIFQSHGFGNIGYVKAAGAAAEGVIFPAGRLLVADTLSDKNPQKALLLSYKKAYEMKYKEDVSTFGGHAYDAMTILEQSIKAAGPGANKEKVRSTIENMKGLVGTGGVFNFTPEDHNGLDLLAFEMLTVKDGKFTLLEQ